MANELTKMFVHYSGTVQEFKNANLETKYNNQIVFIKGGANGNGEAVYTHGKYYGDVKAALAALTQQVNDLKYFTSISDGTKTASASGKNGVITFNAVDPTQVAVEVDSNGVTIGLTDAFKKSVSDNTTNVANVRTDLGNVGDQANSKGSAFARIANLAAVVGQLTGAEGGELKSVESQITEAIGALRTEIVGTLDNADAKTLQAINDELDAIDAKWASYISKAELATEVSDNDGVKVNVTVKTKDGKVSDVVVDETQLEAALNLKANAADVYDKAGAEGMAQGKVNALAGGAVKDNADAIAVLKGNDTVDGSVDKKIKDAINAFEQKVTDDNTINTLKELVDYVAGAKGGDKLADAIAQIAENKGKIETLNGDDKTAGSVAKAIADEALIRKDADDTINARIDSIASVVGAPESDVEATGIFKVIEENEKTTSNALTDLNTRLQDVESKKESIESALQVPDIATGNANGTISVKGVDVKVKGLGSAAYTETSAYATAAQGAKADTAYQKPTAGIPASDLAFAVYTQAEVDAMWAWEEL